MTCSSSRRVVVTGLGLVTPLGLNTQQTWESLLAGVSGLDRISSFNPEGYASQVAGEIKDFEPGNVIEPKELKKMDRFIQLGMVASHEAVAQAGLDGLSDEAKARTGVILGSGVGGLSEIERSVQTLHERGPKRISPFFIPAVLINLLPGHVSMKYGFTGPNFSPVSACATGAHAVGLAFESVRRGEADVIVAGGAEGTVCPISVAGFAASRALSTSYNETPQAASRPFDAARDGFVIAEGAGVMVLEEYEHAKARGADVLAEIVGFGQSGDAYHMTTPSPDGAGAGRAMQAALGQAQVNADQVTYVNAHATSTPAGDEIESGAIERLFGDKVTVSAPKSMTGHMLGAAGSAEAAFCVLSLMHQQVHPTLNLETPGDNCNLDYVPHTARDLKVSYALNNSFGFGGANASLLFKKV